MDAKGQRDVKSENLYEGRLISLNTGSGQGTSFSVCMTSQLTGQASQPLSPPITSGAARKLAVCHTLPSPSV